MNPWQWVVVVSGEGGDDKYPASIRATNTHTYAKATV